MDTDSEVLASNCDSNMDFKHVRFFELILEQVILRDCGLMDCKFTVVIFMN